MIDYNYPLAGLRGAEYNPRHISQEKLKKLWESIRRFGIIKPIICKQDGLIVAGHQRTKALRANGVTHAPVYVLPGDTTEADEIQFNLLHNGADLDCPDGDCWIIDEIKLGWNQVSNIRANWKASQQGVRINIHHLIEKFGPWGASVASLDGEIIHCNNYAMTCIKAGYPLLVYVVEAERKAEFKDYLGEIYGKFHYGQLEKKTYMQTLAQPNRGADVPGTIPRESMLYEEHVYPWLKTNPKARGIDFGSGRGHNASLARSRGFNVLDVELFRRVVGSNAIDQVWVHRAISQMCHSLTKHGQFDFVVCEAVINSVDSPEAESAVATMIGALCKIGGTVFYSGRALRNVNADMRKGSKLTKMGGPGRMEFIDDYGYSGYFRDSDWFYQKWHTYEQRMALGPLVGLTPKEKEVGEYWRCWGEKEFHAPWAMVEKAIEFEFELPWPCGQRINRSEMVKAALRPFWPQDAASFPPNHAQWWPDPMPIDPGDKDLVGFF